MTALVLDQTVLYPQGGGQPCDLGEIKSDNARFILSSVTFKDGYVYHVGKFKYGTFKVNDQVRLFVDGQRRDLHSRLHSAGHIIDLTLYELGYELKPSKGYHFPDGPYLEYEGTLEPDVAETLQSTLEKKANEMAEQNIPISVALMEHKNLAAVSKFVPDNLPTNKPIRVMTVENKPSIPCGGTHVFNTGIIGTIAIKKIKNKKGKTRISYTVLSGLEVRDETELLYLTHMNTFETPATIVDVIPYENPVTKEQTTSLVLDKTIFYPMGGPQPEDYGIIEFKSESLNVSDIKYLDNAVHHFVSSDSKKFKIGNTVHLKIDKPRRLLHSRIHSAGHIINFVLHKIGYPLTLVERSYYPDRTYLKYKKADGKKSLEKIKNNLETEINEIVQKDTPFSTILTKHNEIAPNSNILLECEQTPRYMQEIKHALIPCGGTHIDSTEKIGQIVIKKIETEHKNIRISYTVES